jgi:lipopolysaccharide/colanic/teichoic acid biosynthesis glycosyltransferase
MIKRVCDLGLAAAGLPFFLLLYPILAILISLESAGPPIFSQERVGYKQRLFRLYKFRTMKLGTGDLPSHVAGEDNITSVGRWLRKTKLDELPQILNVLSGDMSFVGPRPCLPSQTELIQAREDLGVFEVRPGITGAAQIQGLNMSEPVRLAQRDSEYCKSRSTMQDLAILWATSTGKGSGDAARPQA